MADIDLTATCARCSRLRLIKARRLCGSCYVMASRIGKLDAWPSNRPRRSAADFVEDYTILTKRGLNNDEIASKMGYANGEVVRLTAHRARRRSS